MPSIFISGIPKGLDRETTSRRIKRDIETVAQVKTIWIQKEKGYGFVSLHAETSVDFVLSLNEKICINGNALRITRCRRTSRLPDTPRRTTAPTCKQQVNNDVFVLRGYDTYTDYRYHRPQSDVLYQYIQQAPKQKQLKRKPWKDVNRVSQLSSPKSRKNIRAKRQKSKKKTTRHKKIKHSTSPSEVGLHSVSKRHKRSKFNSDNDVDDLSNVPIRFTRKASILKGTPESNIETEHINQKLVDSIQTQSSASVHVYDHSKRFCSIEVDNNNVLESIQAGLNNEQLPSYDTILISHNGKTVNTQWQPKMANDDNIHIVVKGKGGMMQGDPPDKGHNADNKMETNSDRTRNTDDTASHKEKYVNKSEQKQNIGANVMVTHPKEDIGVYTCGTRPTTDESGNKTPLKTTINQTEGVGFIDVTVVRAFVEVSIVEKKERFPANVTTGNQPGPHMEQDLGAVGSIVSTNDSEQTEQSQGNESAISQREACKKRKTGSVISMVAGFTKLFGKGEQIPCNVTTKDQTEINRKPKSGADKSRVAVLTTKWEQEEQTSSNVTEGNKKPKAGTVKHIVAGFNNIDVEKEQHTQSILQQVTNLSPFDSTFQQHSEDLKVMIEELDLGRYLPDKLTYESVMSISAFEKDEPDTLADIPRLMIRKLIMLDFSSRESDLNICLTKMNKLSDKALVGRQESNSAISEADFFSCFDPDHDEDMHDDSSILIRRNPIDVFLAIFICLHPTLKQKVCLKMFASHLAIPIMFPVQKDKHQGKVLMFSMWPLRSITVNDGKRERSVVNCKQNIVSFVRLGRPQISKSKLANEILYDTAHNAFFNYDCTLGSSEKQASVGLVEASWFLPSPKQPNNLNAVTLFLNLRGDAFNNAEQLEYLKRVSRVMIIVTDKETMKNKEALEYLKSSNFNVLFLLTGNMSKEFLSKCKQFYNKSSPSDSNVEFIQCSKHGKILSSSDIKEAVFDIIRPLLNDANSATTVQEMCKQARSMGITVDENMLGIGRKRATDVFDKVKNCPLADIKVKYTPLQKQNWKEFSNALKSFRKASQHIEDKEKLKKEMKLQRTQQWLAYNTGNTFMNDFIDIFLTLSDEELVCFLDLLKFEFDEKSRSEMPTYRHSYAAAYTKLQTASDACKAKAETEVKKAEQKLSDASFGIEHVFRELGQIYEASLIANERKLGSKLAKAVARSIKLGYPFELMDGDVANVPLDWIEQIFCELKLLLGNKMLLTMSILGLQSSGKSTFLNAMFGLTFSVSAGRCTRGVYLQLFPVEKGAYKFDYVLVVDTEGLRAPELGDEKYQHDNELATLVLGMADITIVNIKGENTSEVKDILQICVHAFLRLKMANQSLQLHQSCIFIHQNVSDVGAKDSMIHARKKLDETLDKMTLEAAEEENISDIKCFKDVINFDSNQHVWYFSDLWKGDPPMAPANPGYSRDVREVKSFIFKTLTKHKDSYLTISDTFVHIKDLWYGILANDFIFGFRNTLEIRAYTVLESKYQDLIWQLERFTKKLANRAEVEMKQCTAESEKIKDKVRGIFQYTDKIHTTHQTEFKEKQSELEKDLRNHFEESDKKDEIAKWKESKLLAWEMFAEINLGKLKRQLNDIESHCKIDYEMNRSFEKSKKHFYHQAKKLATHTKVIRTSNQEMETVFNAMWQKCERDIDVQEEAVVDIGALLETILFNTFDKHKEILGTEMSKHRSCRCESFTTLENSMNHFGFDENYISVQKNVGSFKKILKRQKHTSIPDAEIKEESIQFTNKILRNMDVRFGNLKRKEWKFDDTDMKEIPICIMEHIDQHNHNKNNKFTFLESYKATLCVHVFQYALPLLKTLDSEYRDKFSMNSKLNNYRKIVWRYFQDVVEEKSATLIACDRFCEVIRDHVVEKVKNSLPDLIYEHIVNEFEKAKFAFIARMMEELAKIHKSEKFLEYIRDPYTYAFKWLTEFINSKCFGCTDYLYKDKASSVLQDIFTVILNSVRNDSASCLHDWLINFQSEIRNTVWIPIESFFVVEDQTITGLDDFITTVGEKLGEVHKELKEIFESETATTIKWHNNKTPYQISMDKLWGCKAICPFCSEPCKWNSIHTGTPHSCIQHRAIGVSGWHNVYSEKLVIESCSFEVHSPATFLCIATGEGRVCTESDSSKHYHPYKDYKKYFPDWDIAPYPDISSSKYWAWVLCTFNEEFAKHYNIKQADIPTSWTEYNQDDAIKSLRGYD